jgi:hypothetical protein
MPESDSLRFAPPAPVAQVTLRHPATAATSSPVPMLIDSGADITLLPQTAVEELGITPEPNCQSELVSFDGKTSLASAVELALIFEGKIFLGQFLVIEQEVGILGRNVLNAVALTLNGPQHSWELHR